MAASKEPLFTPRFFLMCGFTFTVFVSAFQLVPTAPFRIKDLGGSTFACGLFLTALTYASALFGGGAKAATALYPPTGAKGMAGVLNDGGDDGDEGAES